MARSLRIVLVVAVTGLSVAASHAEAARAERFAAPARTAAVTAFPQRTSAGPGVGPVTSGFVTERRPPTSSSANERPAAPSRAPWGVLVQYSLVIAAASLLGGWMPGHVQFSHVRFQMLLSFVGGMLLGIGIFHLLPHAVNHLGVAQIESISIWMMAGIVMMFLLLRAFHVHHHEPEAVPEASAHSAGAVHASGHDHAAGHDHAGSCGHHAHVHAHIPTLPHGRLGWAGMFLGLGIHTLLDGLALGASMQADTIHGVEAWAGLGVLTGVVLHKPLDSLSITALMIAAGCSTRKRALVNVIYALLCPLGAAAFLMGISVAGGMVWQIVGCSLAFSAGIFLCIALADLLPEMEFHSHHRWWLSLCLMLGIGLAWGLRFLEPAHLHR